MNSSTYLLNTAHSRCKPSSSMSSSTYSLQVFLPLSPLFSPTISTILQPDTQSSPLLGSTCLNHINLLRLTTSATLWTLKRCTRPHFTSYILQKRTTHLPHHHTLCSLQAMRVVRMGSLNLAHSSTSNPSSSCFVHTSCTKCRPNSSTRVHVLASHCVQSQPLSQRDPPPNISCSRNQHCVLTSPWCHYIFYEPTWDTLHTRLSCSQLLSYRYHMDAVQNPYSEVRTILIRPKLHDLCLTSIHSNTLCFHHFFPLSSTSPQTPAINPSILPSKRNHLHNAIP